MMGSECQKIDHYTNGYLWFVSFENGFVSKVFADYFLKFLRKNIHENSVGRTLLGCLYHLIVIKDQRI